MILDHRPAVGTLQPSPSQTPPCLPTLGPEDSICDKPDEMTGAEVAGIWVGIIAGVIGLVGSIYHGWKKCLSGCRRISVLIGAFLKRVARRRQSEGSGRGGPVLGEI